MSKVIDSLEKVLLPFAVKIGKQPHINAIKNGFIKLMPLTLAGAMFVLINNVFLSFGEGSFFYSMGNDSNLLIVFYVQIVPDDFVMQLHRF